MTVLLCCAVLCCAAWQQTENRQLRRQLQELRSAAAFEDRGGAAAAEARAEEREALAAEEARAEREERIRLQSLCHELQARLHQVQAELSKEREIRSAHVRAPWPWFRCYAANRADSPPPCSPPADRSPRTSFPETEQAVAGLQIVLGLESIRAPLRASDLSGRTATVKPQNRCNL